MVFSCVKQTNNEKIPPQSVNIISVPLNRWSKRYEVFFLLGNIICVSFQDEKITTLHSPACHLDRLLSLI